MESIQPSERMPLSLFLNWVPIIPQTGGFGSHHALNWRLVLCEDILLDRTWPTSQESGDMQGFNGKPKGVSLVHGNHWEDCGRKDIGFRATSFICIWLHASGLGRPLACTVPPKLSRLYLRFFLASTSLIVTTTMALWRARGGSLNKESHVSSWHCGRQGGENLNKE